MRCLVLCSRKEVNNLCSLGYDYRVLAVARLFSAERRFGCLALVVRYVNVVKVIVVTLLIKSDVCDVVEVIRYACRASLTYSYLHLRVAVRETYGAIGVESR